jgi:hypothetical protein
METTMLDQQQTSGVRYVIPKTYVTAEEIKSGRPDQFLLFAAGPVRGGGNWQAEPLCEALERYHRGASAIVAAPCRWTKANVLNARFMPGPQEEFRRQLNWERYYLELAGCRDRGVRGCILFWLPRESRVFPHPGPEPYGMDTRGELGEWRWRMKTEHARVVVGADPEFHGLSQIQRNFSLALGYNFPIFPTLEKTVEAAIGIALHS